MGLVSMKEMLLKALDEKYAIGQFNINNLEWTTAIIDEAVRLNTPVILGVSEGAAKYMGGFHTVVGFVKGYLKDKDISIPIALHLDHGSSFESCKNAIDAGFTSVMIDASKYPLEENIAMTKKVVDYAHPRGVSVEAELGRVGGEEDDVVAESMYALPHECEQLVKETNVDCLTPALGSVHGPYKGEPKLGFDEMLVIRNLLKNIPLVLHGGSGIPDYQIKMAIERGTCKINVNTECQQAWTKIVRDVIKNNEKVYDPRKIIGPGLKGIQEVVKNKCEVFGCINKG
ncbi:MAG: class II fructose-1,6-bisphosphate aldolase [Bacilli bacterium]|jgi:fructose-bisphosphate aldolase class II|nr:class II fructose-1,6-bisphosphate aldolase [Bacilli bacterium]NLN80391.1 class II fructose-1,6-bisphosphate aldolase [Erysipelotrichia bacterium]